MKFSEKIIQIEFLNAILKCFSSFIRSLKIFVGFVYWYGNSNFNDDYDKTSVGNIS